MGYGDITPSTVYGRTIAIADMLIGVGILTIFSAEFASIFVNKKIREDWGMDSFEFENHLIICEWNYRTKAILKEIRLDSKRTRNAIVLIADLERKPIDDRYLFFVRGQVSDETLQRANLAKAKTVIILGDDRCDYQTRDAKTILSTLTVESINPKVYTIVELVDEAYIPTCQRANADEIIVVSNLSSRLIFNAALNHGISKVISNLLSSNSTNQLDKIPVADSEVGCCFIDILIQRKKSDRSIVIALQKGKGGEVIANPPNEYRLEADDYLIFISGSEQ